MQKLDDLTGEAPILKSTVDLYKEFYLCLKMFPKKDQYLLGKRCEEYILLFVELILVAVAQPRDQKLKTLEQANRKFDMLKVLIRMGRDLKMLDNKKYLSLESRIQEIGKMLGGWIRSLPTKAP